MSRRPPRLRTCAEPGCPNDAIDASYCDSHITANRGRSPSSRVTGTRKFRAIRAMVLKRDGHICQWCGAAATVVDHVVAIANGGSPLDPQNMVAACEPCNASKGARPTPGRGWGGGSTDLNRTSPNGHVAVCTHPHMGQRPGKAGLQ